MNSIQFYGAAQTVTGSKHLITTTQGKKILLDCGLFQGRITNKEEMNRDFGFTPHDLDYVILSHAHIDHTGLLPRLVKLGFRGVIFATPATISLCGLMLMDSAHIQKEDLRYINKRRVKKGEEVIEALYDQLDVEKALDLMVSVEYEEVLKIDKDITLTFTDAGHLLGSAAINLDLSNGKGKKTKLTFTGDIGRFNDQILRPPQPFRQCDILICESTYGNRLHPTAPDIEQELLEVITTTCVQNKGKLIIPAFSVDRTQDLIFMLDKFANKGLLPPVKVFVDSPLSVKATGVIRKHEECYNDNFLAYLHKDPDPFGFNDLTYVSEVTQSKAINDIKEPCIIISASGMAEAGRIKHHIANNIGNPKNTILMVGYCTPESLGGKLKAGEKQVRIFGEPYDVKARVVNMDYFSAHADYKEILQFLQHQKADKVSQVFLVHGEYTAQQALQTKLAEVGFNNIHIPKQAERFEFE
jgi:metallo-beta-lactamase family protein